jgi:hypothetical protein
VLNNFGVEMPEFEFRSPSGSRHGRPYTLEEFAAKYQLDEDRAKALFHRFGPSSVDLDLLMRAKAKDTKGSADC